MKSITGNYFESKVRFEKQTAEGELVKFVGLFVVDAMSFTECEAKVTEEVAKLSNDFEVVTETRAAYREIFFSDEECEKWFKVKVDFMTADDNGKEKHSKNVYLVQANGIDEAKRNVDDVLKGSMIEYSIIGLNEINVEDVILRKELKDE